jgi:hypothetical protein
VTVAGCFENGNEIVLPEKAKIYRTFEQLSASQGRPAS